MGNKAPVDNWTPRPLPFAHVDEAYRYPTPEAPGELEPVLVGRDVELVPMSVAHAHDLFAAFSKQVPGATKNGDDVWTYMPIRPPADEEALRSWIAKVREDRMLFYLTIKIGVPRRVVGFISLMRAQPEAGSIEIGWVTFSPQLQRTYAASEVFYLLIRYCMDDLGYRRLEWKCDAANLASRRAAARLGFSWEGMFRNALVMKGLNRDTAWFGMTADDWRVLHEKAYRVFFAPDNFDSSGAQRTSLSELTAPLLYATDPLQDHERAAAA